MDPGPTNYSPSYMKVASFFEHGAVSGVKLDQAEEELAQKTGPHLLAGRSYDDQPKGIPLKGLSLNCVSAMFGIRQSLFGSAANGGLIVAVEEIMGEKGIIDDVYSRIKEKIELCEKDCEALGIKNPVTLKRNFHTKLHQKLQNVSSKYI